MWDVLTSHGHEVFGLDDLSRQTAVPRISPRSVVGDVVDIRRIPIFVQDFDWVVHLAGQVSVVAGESNPERDFHTNARGTFEVVQWAKERDAGVIYSSTNKVFGELDGLRDPIQDDAPLNPQTNYGVSKAAGAQYVADYERGWALHQSCIYGPTQFGEIDQGWIGWLRNSILRGSPITCFGDGTQVRDILHVSDLITLYECILNGAIPAGSYIAGGGAENTVTFEEAVRMLGGEIASFTDWRPHDQRYFVSANSGLTSFGWTSQISKSMGIAELSENFIGDDSAVT